MSNVKHADHFGTDDDLCLPAAELRNGRCIILEEDATFMVFNNVVKRFKFLIAFLSL